MAGLAMSIPRSLDALFDLGVIGDQPDGPLIERVTARHREAAELAFHALVERHGSMVLRVCRQLLDDPNDAEDAFQATFLVLLRRAGSIRDRGSVASWLHGVAMRVASRARVESARRRRIERHGIRPESDRADHAGRLDLEMLIDEELTRLPEKYRAPVVLCYLEGMTHEGAAARLGWPVGTVRGRLSRARDLLRTRLTRRGVAAPAALAAVDGLLAPARAAVPDALGEATLRAAVAFTSGRTVAAAASARVAAWVVHASRGLVLERVRLAAGVVLMLGTIGTGLAMLAAPATTQEQRPGSPDPREAARREMLQLKGTWTSMQTLESTVNGIPQPPKPYKLTWAIDRDTITESDPDGFAARTYRFTVDPEKAAGTIDLTVLNLDLKLQGLYKLSGDDLTVSMGLERPADLHERPGRILIHFHRESRLPAKLARQYPTARDCDWAIEPGGSVPSSMHSSGIDFLSRKDSTGALVVTLAYMTRARDDRAEQEYRPVAFDDRRGRFLPKLSGGGGSGSAAIPGANLVLREYRLDPEVLPFDRVKTMGIESVSADARRADDVDASARAIQQAREAGIEVLPLPEVGKPFTFSLTDTKGRVIRSADLMGKVVLIDCWAGWCTPCMAKMPRLKALYQRRHPDGLEVVGINFDKDRAIADELVKTLGLPWVEVQVPADDRTRDVWRDGAGIHGLPRLLLIDRQGILRWDGPPAELEARIESMLR